MGGGRVRKKREEIGWKRATELDRGIFQITVLCRDNGNMAFYMCEHSVVPKAGRGQEVVELLKTLPRVRGEKVERNSTVSNKTVA